MKRDLPQLKNLPQLKRGWLFSVHGAPLMRSQERTWHCTDLAAEHAGSAMVVALTAAAARATGGGFVESVRSSWYSFIDRSAAHLKGRLGLLRRNRSSSHRGYHAVEQSRTPIHKVLSSPCLRGRPSYSGSPGARRSQMTRRAYTRGFEPETVSHASH